MGEASPDPAAEEAAPPHGGERVRPTPVRPQGAEAPPAAPAPTAPPARTAVSRPEPSSKPKGGGPRPAARGQKSSVPALRPEAASRHFTSGGSEWIARAVGRVSIGRARSGSAHFMLVTFSRAENPDAAALELLVEGRELTRFGELELSELLTRARPYSGASRKPGIFPEIRSGKKDER